MLMWLERIAWIVGLALLAIYGSARVSSERARLEGIATLEEAREALIDEPFHASASPHTPDMSLWSASRIDAWRRASNTVRDRPQAVLSLASVDLRVPVFEGTNHRNLDKGAGRIEGTARIGELGNIGLAAHRDGYFRALKDVRIGDRVQLTTLREVQTYRIVATAVVDPTAVEVLAPTEKPMLTLVTCYPFYFVGSAPRRFIVHAELIQNGRERAYTVSL